MDEESTTAANDQETDSQATDQQTADDSNNLDTSNQDDTQSTDDAQSTDDGEETDSSAAFDDDLDDWIAKRNFTAETDDERRSFQDLRNEQREFTREQQAKQAAKDAAALNKDITAERDALNLDEDEDDENDELANDVKQLKAERLAERTTRLQSEFYTDQKVSAEQHKAITDIIKEKVARAASPQGKLQALDIWGSPEALPDLLDLANARLYKSTDNSAETEAALKAERERIAKESNATSTNRGAKTITTGNKTPEQERLDRFSNWK